MRQRSDRFEANCDPDARSADAPSADRRSGWESAASALLRTCPFAVLVLDDQRIVEAGDAAVELLGRDRSALIGVTLRSISAPMQPDGRPADLSLAGSIAESLDSESAAERPWLFTGADGTVIEAQIRLSSVRRDSHILCMIVVSRHCPAAETEASVRAAQRMELLGQLTGGIAHDFNNLLTAIEGHIDLALASPSTDPEQRGSLEIARNCTERASALSRRLLDLSRDRWFEPRSLSLNRLVRETGEFLRRLIRADVRIELELDDSVGAVAADAAHLEQAIMNLAINAEDAMPHGGVITLATSNQIVERGFRHAWVKPGRYVKLELRDTGVGIPLEDQARVFEPFFTSKARERGTGLGLSIVYGIVKQHRGFVGLESRPGQGTTFWLLLPPAPALVARAELPREPDVAGEPPPVDHETILVVEDEPVVRQLAASALTSVGYRVLEADSAEEADRIFENERGRIDLLLTDMILAGASGRELAATLQLRKPGLKIVYTSGYDSAQLPEHLAPEPDRAFLEKPYTLSALTRKVSEVIRH